MGWITQHLEKGICPTTVFNQAHWGERFKILKTARVGKAIYQAIKIEAPKTEKDYVRDADGNITFAAIFLISFDNKDYYNFGWKSQTETCGPGAAECPPSILNLLSPFTTQGSERNYAIQWRADCRQNAKRKANAAALRRSIKPGDILTSTQPIYVEDTVYPTATQLTYNRCPAYGIYFTAPDGEHFRVKGWAQELVKIEIQSTALILRPANA